MAWSTYWLASYWSMLVGSPSWLVACNNNYKWQVLLPLMAVNSANRRSKHQKHISYQYTQLKQRQTRQFTRLEYSIDSSECAAGFPLIYVNWGHGSRTLHPRTSQNISIIPYEQALYFSCTTPGGSISRSTDINKDSCRHLWNNLLKTSVTAASRNRSSKL